MADERRTTEAHDRLTRMCAAMTDVFEAHVEHREGDKCIVFLDDGDRGGLVLHGYDSDVDALADLFMHLKAIFKANGKELLIAPLGNADPNAN
jgi:hypothetical protein